MAVSVVFLPFLLTTKLSYLQKITVATLPSTERFRDYSKQTFVLLVSTDIHVSHGLLVYALTFLNKGFEWVIPYVIPCEGYLVAMQFLDLTGGNFFVSSLTLLDGSFQV